MSNLKIYVDGARKGSGAGGWAIVVYDDDTIVWEEGGRVEDVTNNQMELQAAVAAMTYAVKSNSCKVTVYSDSQYVVKGFSNWVWNWRQNGWVTSKGEAVLNQSYWESLVALSGKFKKKFNKAVDFKWVKGHSGDPGNERADLIAVAYSNYKENTLELVRDACLTPEITESAEEVVESKVDLGDDEFLNIAALAFGNGREKIFLVKPDLEDNFKRLEAVHKLATNKWLVTKPELEMLIERDLGLDSSWRGWKFVKSDFYEDGKPLFKVLSR